MIEQSFNKNKSSPLSPKKFKKNTQVVLSADIFLADIINNDPGVYTELDIAIMSLKKPIIIFINSDIRLKDVNHYRISPS